jgi:hypothetical protein
MQRRDFMKAALAATVAPSVVLPQSAAPKKPTVVPGPLPWMEGLDQGDLPPVKTVGLDEVAQPMQSFFTPTQRATLIRLCEVLVPAWNGRPGAIEADVPAFLDFFVGKSLPDVQLLYRDGLDGFDAEAKTKHSKPFANLGNAEVDAILKPLLATWMQDHYPTEKDKHFVAAAHHDILTATQNSPAWLAASAKSNKPPFSGDLYWFPVEPILARNLL